MGPEQDQVGTAVEGEQRGPEQIRREIEATREDLGDTAAALAAKTDVKARAKEKVEGVKQTIAEKSPESAGAATTEIKAKAQANPIPTAAIAAFVGGFLFGRITKR